jgi:hypothetical protein
MPTVLRDEGFEVRIYTSDHPPPHVHVAKAGAIAARDAEADAIEAAGLHAMPLTD